MNRSKKIIRSVLIILLALLLGALVSLLLQMYVPVLKASKDIPEVKEYAQSLDDKLVDSSVEVIGLGEATHGNKEFQELKLDVLKNLVSNNDVRTLCFEMDYAEGVLINDYICGRSSMDSKELFSHISFDLYHTEEIRELIEWMKTYNAGHKDRQLKFYGCDMQNPDVDIYVIRQFIRDNKIALHSAAMDDYIDGKFDFKDDRADEMFRDLTAFKTRLSSAEYRNYSNIDSILACIDSVFLAKELAALSSSDLVAYGTRRDEAMADRILEICNADSKPVMLAGHNGHIGYAGSYVKTMGSYLKEKLGDKYFVIGTDYFKTKDSIKSSSGRKNHLFFSADPLAYQAKELGTYYLRFDALKSSEKLNEMVSGKMSTGSIGESFSPLNLIMPGSIRVYTAPRDMYDAMIFVYKASPFTALDE